ncbi:MAG: PilW family protein [Waterburya sp.]
MKSKKLQKLLKKNKSHAGFTLTELLVGLFMSIFVIGALGFGLMQVLQATQTEGSKTAARNETGRALDFISDELRRAQAVEVNLSEANISAVAPDYDDNPLTGGTVRLALEIPDVDQRVIYSVAPPQSGSPWKGPLVIYRWGPELRADGSYVTNPTSSGRVDNPDGWTNEALIDKIDDAEQTERCGGTDTIFYGFFGCVIDDDGDGFTEDATDVDGNGEINSDDLGVTDKNSDGKVNNEDGADIDGQAITAQLYFTGETITVTGASGYSADTQTVARARIAPENNSEDLNSYTMSFRTLNPSFACNSDPVDWKMRTDFGESLTNPGSIINWDHKKNRQPQPISIPGDTLVISSIPIDPRKDHTDPLSPLASDCNNRRSNNGRESTNPSDRRDFSGNIELGQNDPEYDPVNAPWVDKDDVVAISHFIDFKDPTTFNGDKQGTCDGNNICAGSNGGKVNTKKSDGNKEPNTFVAMLKRGSIVPNTPGNVHEGQLSLGEFLYTQSPSLATKTKTGVDANGNDVFEYRITNELQPDERIIGFEIGKDTPGEKGFDLQDNIFIVKSEAFSKEYDDGYIPLQ